MKKALSFLLITLMLWPCIAFANTGQAGSTAGNPISYSISVSPSEVDEPAAGNTVGVSVTVTASTNDSSVHAHTFEIYSGDTKIASSESGAEVSNGKNVVMQFTVYLTASDLGKNRELYAKYSYYTQEDPASVPYERHSAGTYVVNKKEMSSYIEVTIRPDKTVVEKNGTVTISGTVKNISNTEISNVQIQLGAKYDSISASIQTVNIPIGTLGNTEANNTKTFSHAYTNVQGDFTLSPRVMYTASNKDYDEKQEAFKVAIKHTEAQFYLVARPKASGKFNETITIVYTIINTGNVALEGLSIFNENNDKLTINATSLSPGKTLTGSVSLKITGDKTVRYSLSATDTLGADYQANSNGVDITLETSIDDLLLGVVASTQTPMISGPGQVAFEIEVSNKSLFAVSTITVYDDTGEVVQTINGMDPEGVKSFSVVRTINETRNVFFKVVVLDKNNNEKSFETEVIMVTVGGEGILTPTPGVTETETIMPSPTTGEVGGGSIWDTLLIILYVVIGLILASVAALVIMNVLQKRQARNSRKIKRRIK